MTADAVPDNLDIAEQMAQRMGTMNPAENAMALALIDIARTLREINGELCDLNGHLVDFDTYGLPVKQKPN